MTDETQLFPNGRAEPDEVSDAFFRNALIFLIVGIVIALAVFSSVAWRGSTYDRPAGGTTQVD